MQGRAFLAPARHLLAQPQEAFWRAALGRAYYGLMLEARELLARWGFVPGRRDSVHTFVRLRLVYTVDPDLSRVGRELDLLCQLRNKADYDLHTTEFLTDTEAVQALKRASDGLARLEAVDADPARRVAAIADIRARWP